jgi:hypothetical protein
MFDGRCVVVAKVVRTTDDTRTYYLYPSVDVEKFVNVSITEVLFNARM